MSGSESDRVAGEGVILSKGVGKASLMRWHLNRDLKVAKDKSCRGWKELDWWVWVTWSRVWLLRSHSKENDEAARGVGGSAATWMDPEWSHWAKAVRQRKTNATCYHLYVDSKSMIQMNLFTKQKGIHRLRKQIHGHHRGEEGFLMAQVVKNLPAMQETRVWSLGQVDPCRRERSPTPESHGQKSLSVYSPWVSKSQTQMSD